MQSYACSILASMVWKREPRNVLFDPTGRVGNGQSVVAVHSISGTAFVTWSRFALKTRRKCLARSILVFADLLFSHTWHCSFFTHIHLRFETGGCGFSPSHEAALLLLHLRLNFILRKRDNDVFEHWSKSDQNHVSLDHIVFLITFELHMHVRTNHKPLSRTLL